MVVVIGQCNLCVGGVVCDLFVGWLVNSAVRINQSKFMFSSSVSSFLLSLHKCSIVINSIKLNNIQ